MIDLTRQHNDVGFAVRLASFIAELEEPDPVRNLQRIYRDDFDGVPVFIHPIASDGPCWIIAKMPTGVLILLAGALNVRLGLATLGSYSLDVLGESEGYANPMFWRLAQQIVTAAAAFGANLDGNVRIAGHSLGGAIAACLQYQIEIGMNNNRCQTIIMNAPRLGRGRFCYEAERMALTRYFCNDDPVQFVPFHTDEATLAHTLLTWQCANAYNQQTHPRGGIAIEPSGILANRDMPAGPLPNTSLSLIEWLAYSTTGPGVNHKIAEVTARLRAAADLISPGTIRPRLPGNEQPETIRPRTLPTGPQPAPLAEPVARRLITAARPEAAAQARANEEMGDSVAVVPNGRFRPCHEGPIWGVKYNDDVVELTSGKREAKTRSRRYNRALRQTEEPALPPAVQAIIALPAEDVESV